MRERKVRARDVERPQSKYRGKRRCLLSSLVYLAQAPVGCLFPGDQRDSGVTRVSYSMTELRMREALGGLSPDNTVYT